MALKRNPTPLFIIVESRFDRKVEVFNCIDDFTTWMWGKDYRHYWIRVAGRVLEIHSGNETHVATIIGAQLPQ